MTQLNLKDFLASSAFIQVGLEEYMVLVGPFTSENLPLNEAFSGDLALFHPNFWDFLSNSENLSLSLPKQLYRLSRQAFFELLKPLASVQPHIDWQQPKVNEFEEQYQWSQSLFSEKQLEKTVPIIEQAGATNFSEENFVWCLNHLLNFSGFGWGYGYINDGQGYLGFTPEKLLTWKDGQAETVALAGTWALNEFSENLVTEDKKTWREHQIVIEDIETKMFGLLERSDYQVEKTKPLMLKTLVHLMTEFKLANLNQVKAIKVINSLHPTAAMGIFPNNVDLLKQFSQFKLQQQRESFAAPFAVVGKDSIQCLVTIRRLDFAKNSVRIFSGCGVTNESHLQSELKELENKRNSVKLMMGLTQ